MPTFNDVERDKTKIVPAIMAVMKRHDEELEAKAIKSIMLDGNVLKLIANDDTEVGSVDLVQFEDDTNLSRVVSGTIADTGIMTLTRDDASTFDVDMSILLNMMDKFVVGGLFDTPTSSIRFDLNDGTTFDLNLQPLVLKAVAIAKNQWQDDDDLIKEKQVTAIDYGTGMDGGLPEIGKNRVKLTLADGTELVSSEVEDDRLSALNLSADGKSLIATMSVSGDISVDLPTTAAGGDSIYTADGTINEDRIVSKGTNKLTFEGTGGYSTVISKSDHTNGGTYRVAGADGYSEFFQNGNGWFLWNSTVNRNNLSFSPDVDKVRVHANLRLDKQVFDETNLAGADGEVLFATATGTKWGSVTKAHASFRPNAMSTSGNAFVDLVLGAPDLLEGLTFDSATNEIVADKDMVINMTAILRIRQGNANQNALRFYKNNAILGGSTALEANSATYFMLPKTQLIALVAGDRVKIAVKGELSATTYNTVSITEV